MSDDWFAFLKHCLLPKPNYLLPFPAQHSACRISRWWGAQLWCGRDSNSVDEILIFWDFCDTDSKEKERQIGLHLQKKLSSFLCCVATAERELSFCLYQIARPLILTRCTIQLRQLMDSYKLISLWQTELYFKQDQHHRRYRKGNFMMGSVNFLNAQISWQNKRMH